MLLLTPAENAPTGDAAGPFWYWVLSADGQQPSGQGVSACAELPQDAECVLVVPVWQLSWQRVALPKVAPARLRAALDGLLEEHLLDDTAQLHFALEPGSRPGQAAGIWVGRRKPANPGASQPAPMACSPGRCPTVTPGPTHYRQRSGPGCWLARLARTKPA